MKSNCFLKNEIFVGDIGRFLQPDEDPFMGRNKQKPKFRVPSVEEINQVGISITNFKFKTYDNIFKQKLNHFNCFFKIR